MPVEQRYAVDRIEGETAVLMGDDGAEVALPMRNLGCAVEEGFMLLVPVGRDGWPQWRRARVDSAERERRIEHGTDVLQDLEARDPGGDVST
jgi:hypothetical protein